MFFLSFFPLTSEGPRDDRRNQTTEKLSSLSFLSLSERRRRRRRSRRKTLKYYRVSHTHARERGREREEITQKRALQACFLYPHTNYNKNRRGRKAKKKCIMSLAASSPSAAAVVVRRAAKAVAKRSQIRTNLKTRNHRNHHRNRASIVAMSSSSSDATTTDLLSLNENNVSSNEELNNSAITERRTRTAEDARRVKAKKEIKSLKERLKKAKRTETERRRKEDAIELKMQDEETKKRAEEDARRVRADRALEGVFEKEMKRLQKIERATREEEDEMLGVLRAKIERLQKNDEDIAAYAKDALMVARQAVKDLESELERQKSAVVKRRKQCAKEARKRVKEMQRNREAEEKRVNKSLKGGKSGNDDELDKKRFEYKLRMDTEQHEKLLMDEARLQLIEDADIKRVEVTLNEALVAVEKVKDEEGERRDFVQKELSVFLDEFAIKDSEVQSRRENFDVTLSSECEAVSITAKKEEVQMRTEEEARRVEFTKALRRQRKNEEERRAEWDRDHFADVQKLEEMKSNEASTRRRENTRRSAFATSFAQKDANAAAIFLALYLESLEKSDLSRDEDMADVMEADGALYAAAENIRRRRESEEYKRDYEMRKAMERSEYFAELERTRKVQEAKAAEAREKAMKLREERIAAAKAKREQFLELSKKRAEEQKEKLRVASELREKRRAEAEAKRLKDLEDERVRMEKRMQEEREAVNGKKEAAAAAAAVAPPVAPKPVATTTAASAVVAPKKEEALVREPESGFVATNPSTAIRASGSIAKMKTDALWNENYKKFLKFIDQAPSSSPSSSSSTTTAMPKQVEQPKKKEQEPAREKEVKTVAEKKPVVAVKKEVPQSILDSRDAVAIAQHLVDTNYDAKTVANAVSTLYTNGGRRGSDLANEVFMTLPKSISGAALVNIEDDAVACKLLENCEPGRQTVDLSEPSTSESSSAGKKFFLAYSSRKAMYAGVEILEVASLINEARAVEIYSNISRIPRASIVKRAVLQQGSRPGMESKNPESKPPSKINWIAKLLAKMSVPSVAVQTLETFRGKDQAKNAYVKDIVEIIRKNEDGDIEGAQAFAKILESRLL